MTAAKTALVITSIAGSDHPVLQQFARETKEAGMEFIVIGDVPSPADFTLDHCQFFSLADQETLTLSYAALAPKRHYARKNIGYLIAFRNGAEIIIETDDDNIPLSSFWNERVRTQTAPRATNTGWLNVYRYFSTAMLWPRGFPLENISLPVPAFDSFKTETVDCPVQQGLANDNPDVDALYRLLFPLPQTFTDGTLALGPGTWTPFNSQNTTWWKDAAPLMYLPAYCSFRMTDIWRSFVALRVMRETKWHLLFHSPTVRQERNEHDLMRDFKDEVPGYLNNSRIMTVLEAVPLTPGTEHIGENLYRCYEALVQEDLIPDTELPLVRAWLTDLATL